MINLVIPHWLEITLVGVGLAAYAVSCFLFGMIVSEGLWRIARASNKVLGEKI